MPEVISLNDDEIDSSDSDGFRNVKEKEKEKEKQDTKRKKIRTREPRKAALIKSSKSIFKDLDDLIDDEEVERNHTSLETEKITRYILCFLHLLFSQN